MSLEQASSPVTSAQVASNTLALYLDRYVRLASRAPKVGLQIVYEDASGLGKNSYVHAFNTRSRLSGVAVVTENDAAPEARASLTQGTITGNRRGLRTFILDQADLVSIQNEYQVNADQLLEAWDQYWHAQILALFTSVSASTGSAATNNTLSNWDTVTGLFRNTNHDPGELWAVLNPDAVRDLKADLLSNAASLYGTTWGEQKIRATQENQPGLGTMFSGYMLYESGDTPAGDTTGWTNCLGIKAGPNSSLEIDVYERGRIRVQRDESRFGGWQVVGGISGVGIRTQANTYAFITRT